MTDRLKPKRKDASSNWAISAERIVPPLRPDKAHDACVVRKHSTCGRQFRRLSAPLTRGVPPHSRVADLAAPEMAGLYAASLLLRKFEAARFGDSDK